MKCAQLVCYPDIHERTRDDVTNKETTGEGPGLQKNTIRIIVGVKREESNRRRI